MRVFRQITAIFSLVLVTGCGEVSQVTPGSATGDASAQAAAAPKDPVKTASDADTADAADIKDPAAAPAQSESNPTIIADTGTPASQPADDPANAPAAAQSDTAADGSAPAEAAATEAAMPVDPLVEGLEFPNVDINELFTETKSAWEKEPDSIESVSNYIALIANLAREHSDRGNAEKAAAAIAQAEELLSKSMTAGLALPQDLSAFVYYQSAGVLSTIGKPEEALVKVEKAIENGFTQLPILLEDPALEKVRELPAWSEKLSTWEAAARERMIESAKAEMADYQSFPFDFTLTDVAGMPVSLAALKGKVCIVDLWGTWCPPCREEIPSFIKLQQKFAAAGFQMIGLNEERGGSDEDKTAKVTEFIAQSGINYPCALITDEVRAQVPDLQGYPTTLFIDRSGKVRLMAVGMHEYAYLEAVVEMLLNEDSGETAAPAAPASDAAAPPEK